MSKSVLFWLAIIGLGTLLFFMIMGIRDVSNVTGHGSATLSKWAVIMGFCFVILSLLLLIAGSMTIYTIWKSFKPLYHKYGLKLVLGVIFMTIPILIRGYAALSLGFS